ncbi:unnamed protein product [Ambrosiozyma monospora]|uniref:Unnamed protein product n=1 Tax=Ambrosiozyma monospora TaxID=43982 RepID=A0ACB5UAC0_AMBMO|nr:unnamed protein product [Ambrosiozyma monospora]
MYDFISETALTWPSLSIQWVPTGTFTNKTKDTKYSKTRNLVLTTHTSGEDMDFLKIASTQLPASVVDEGVKLTPEELETVNSRLKISKKFEQSSEINRARYEPQDPKVLATINGEGKTFVYQLDEKMNEVNKIDLKHHTVNGFGLSWNPVVKSQLLTCGDDKTVAFWDLSQSDYSKLKSLEPTKVFTTHTDIVNDVKWHNFDGFTFGSF